jgi:hypothetical protein
MFLVKNQRFFFLFDAFFFFINPLLVRAFSVPWPFSAPANSFFASWCPVGQATSGAHELNPITVNKVIDISDLVKYVALPIIQK